MKKYLSTGVFWLIYFIISIFIIINKYISDKANFFKFSWNYGLIIFGFLLGSAYTYYVGKHKSQAMSITSFIFGLTFWIPLLNLIFGLLAVYTGVKALIRIKKMPTKYGGRWFAIIGIILGALVYITYITGIGMCLFGYKEICNNIGLTLLAQ